MKSPMAILVAASLVLAQVPLSYYRRRQKQHIERLLDELTGVQFCGDCGSQTVFIDEMAVLFEQDEC